MQDQQVRQYYTFLLSLSLFLFVTAIILCGNLTSSAKTMLLQHDETIAASLAAQGVPETIIATALTDTSVIFDAWKMKTGAELLRKIGIRPELENQFFPQLYRFRRDALCRVLSVILLVCLSLLGGSLLFLHRRNTLYHRATSIINSYADGSFSCRLPQTDEGSLYRMFSAVDRLATMLQAQNDVEHQSKLFLRNAISDISHQLKTPLAALSMYQEIMENESHHPDVIRQFAAKSGTALQRMDQLIQSMLKIARLDSGNIVFENQRYDLQKLISDAVSELTARAEDEGKTILIENLGTTSAMIYSSDTILCDPAWTGEAIGNIVKNALDHTRAEGTIRITWETSPFSTMIRIADDGDGIAPEDIHHIFKRFYRSRQSSGMQGIGLGLPLAKLIVEGQGGTITVQSTPRVGTCFTILFPHGAQGCDSCLF
ncbi:MAG: HAMP domain-containing histidine kinase [Lachnospiraceae bacterium]|nr:HAMP domain-containing histidine kinase [Lachnospiraceae bacterium]